MSNPWKNKSLLNCNISPYLVDYTNKWVVCQYCGRTLQYSQLMSHWRTFHNCDRGLIIDFDHWR